MGIVERTIRSWQERRVELNPPASAADLQTLGHLLRREIPNDVRDFYLYANGMPAHVYDQHEVSFWSIPKIREECAESQEKMVGFADFLIYSWRFLFAVDESGVTIMTENVPPGSPVEALGSFSEFLQRYEANPCDLGVL